MPLGHGPSGRRSGARSRPPRLPSWSRCAACTSQPGGAVRIGHAGGAYARVWTEPQNIGVCHKIGGKVLDLLTANRILFTKVEKCRSEEHTSELQSRGHL